MNWTGTFSSMLTGWQWFLLLAVPPLIVALYFLKLRRHPLEVPSTYLWSRTIEDLHVNSLWQRLRQNLLLFLQLLLLLLLILACLRPSWRGSVLSGDRFIFLIDTSASMSATDSPPTRLSQAKQKVDDLIAEMSSGDVAMLVSFSDRARVEQPFTTDRRLLRKKLAALSATQGSSDISEALRVASGLANPGRSGDRNTGDVAVAAPLPAEVYIFSDGAFRSVPDFAWENLKPVFVPIGESDCANIAITAFSASRVRDATDQLQAFVRVENFTDKEQVVQIDLAADGRPEDVVEVKIPASGATGAEFTLTGEEVTRLKVTLDVEDALALDNVAYVAVNPSRQAKVLVVTPGNDALQLALSTDEARKLAEILFMTPDQLTTPAYQKPSQAGVYDLILFDQCAPDAMPRANTLFLGRAPPTDDWALGEKQDRPQVVDMEATHPLLQYVNFGNVLFTEMRPVKGPRGSRLLIEADGGPMAEMAPREGFEDLVLGFEIVGLDDQGNEESKTDWPRRISFPVFIRNVLVYLGRGTLDQDEISVSTGQPISLKSDTPSGTLQVTTPSGKVVKVARSRQNAFVYSATDEIGVYEVRDPGSKEASQRFAVNLFDPIESQIRPRADLATRWEKIPGQLSFQPTRRDAWRWILIVALGVLVFEWYVFNRRVYF